MPPAAVSPLNDGVPSVTPVASRFGAPGTTAAEPPPAEPRAPARTSADARPARSTIERSKPDVACFGSICAM